MMSYVEPIPQVQLLCPSRMNRVGMVCFKKRLLWRWF